MSAAAWKTYAHTKDRGFITRDPDERFLPIAKPGPAKTGLFQLRKICSSKGQDIRFSFLKYGFESHTDNRAKASEDRAQLGRRLRA
jgi:hypothetical protein